MKKYLFLMLVGLLAGCDKGPSGPTGPQGATGPGSTAYTVEFENGVYPDAGYAGCDSHWIDGNNPNSAPTTGEIQVGYGNGTFQPSLGLIRFDLSYGLPVNANIMAASLQLTTETGTILSGVSNVFGVHQVIPPPAGQITWNDSSTWNVVVSPYGWDGGTSSPITVGADYASTPMDAVTVTPAQVNSNQVLLAWNITPTLAQVWANKSNNNYGILISPEPETTGTLSGFIAFWDNTGNSQQKPRLLVTYTIP